ncbi:hypothetical protein BYT27DRAFT_7210728 [Phlegmacium glaucopus]|nr:hypothetical protein BYT27DRAFT_7210728 [Phlegmacium glaucopus]
MQVLNIEQRGWGDLELLGAVLRVECVALVERLGARSMDVTGVQFDMNRMCFVHYKQEKFEVGLLNNQMCGRLTSSKIFATLEIAGNGVREIRSVVKRALDGDDDDLVTYFELLAVFLNILGDFRRILADLWVPNFEGV